MDRLGWGMPKDGRGFEKVRRRVWEEVKREKEQEVLGGMLPMVVPLILT